MSIAGVTLRPGVSLTAGQEAYLRLLRTRVPERVSIIVTSAGRGYYSQAAAMLKKYQAGGAQELYDVYAADATITKLLAAPRTTDAWAQIIKQDVESGVRLSRHLAGGAVDLHTSTLTKAEVDALVAGVKATGGRPLLEDAPVHLHVDLPTGYAVASGAETAAPVWLGLGAVGALVLVAVAWRRRSQKGPISIEPDRIAA